MAFSEVQVPSRSSRMVAKWNKAVTFVAEGLEKVNLDPFELKECDQSQFTKLGGNDVVVASFPKSGSALVGEIVSNLIQEFEGEGSSRTVPVPLFERTTEEEAAEMEGPKLFTSNIRYELLAKHMDTGTKVIYVVRDPKHAAWELYNASFIKQMNFRDFIEFFMHGADPSNPYHYKTHFLQFLENEQNLDILFLKFEDFDQNPKEAVREIQQYLGIKRKLRSAQMAWVLGVSKKAEGKDLTTWGNVAKSISNKNMATFFEKDIQKMFDIELKVDWGLVKSGTV